MNKKHLLSALLLGSLCLNGAFAQTTPKVTTDKRYARGATMIFARMTYTTSGTVKEKGFCYSYETDKPTIDNERSTKYFSNNGFIYKMSGLTPCKKYYVRPYVITSTGEVGYGEPLKVYTLPKGQITWSYDNGADAETNKRINAAVDSAVRYWNHLTSIKGFGTSVHYGAQTPTADCSYGGWMRIGPNASYQRIGTVMHEMLHGIGVGTQDIWWNSSMRSNGDRGYWLGDRVNEFLHFWDNNETEMMNGDNTHLWPYGINGAHEDNGTDMLYCATSLIAQAVGEDGLPPVSGRFCTPAYVFNQEDTIKYYIKSESSDHGKTTSFLVPGANNTLKWSNVSVENGVPNDSAAWFVTYNPTTCMYSFRNAATGKYITYSSGMRTKDTQTPSGTEEFHLMRSRTDDVIGSASAKYTTRGYWIIRNNGTYASPCLTASANGNTTTSTFAISGANKAQRWLIETIEGISKIDDVSIGGYKKKLSKLVDNINAMLQVEHNEDTTGITQHVATQLEGIAKTCETATTAGEIDAAITEATALAKGFLRGTSVKSIGNPYDISFLFQDIDLKEAEGWNISEGTPELKNGCAAFTNEKFNMQQIITDMPKGTYKATANAFQRPGDISTVFKNYKKGSSFINAKIALCSKNAKMANIIADAQSERLGGSEAALDTIPIHYVPNDLAAAKNYFDKDLYHIEVVAPLTYERTGLSLTISNLIAGTNYWTSFGNIHIYAYGNRTYEDVTGIGSPTIANDAPQSIHLLDGRTVRQSENGFKNLPKGFYIIGNKKVVVR